MTRHVHFDLTPAKAGFATDGCDFICSTGTDGEGTTLTIARNESGQVFGLLGTPSSNILAFEANIIESLSSMINARIAISDSVIRVFLNDDLIAEFKSVE